MSALPSYLWLGAAILIFFFVFFLRRLDLFMRLIVMLGRLAVVVGLIFAVGWAVGLWQIPPVMEGFLSRIPQPWRAAQLSFVEWFVSHFP